MQQFLKYPVVKFAVVGGVGFVADSLVFAFCLQILELSLLSARAIAFVVAATVTWLGNRCFTFANVDQQHVSIAEQWAKFMCSASVAALPNFAVFQTLLWILGKGGIAPYIALAAGILSGMVFNYLLSRRWVFAVSTVN